MLCLNKNPKTKTNKTFDRFYCSNPTCSFCSKPDTFDFQYLLEQIENKNNRPYKGYQKIIQFYDSTIKCLEMDRNRLLQMMKSQNTYQFNHSQRKLQELFQTGISNLNNRDLMYLQYLFSNESLQQNIKKQLIGFQELFQNMFMNIRHIWIPDILEGLEKMNKIFQEYKLDKIKNNLIKSDYSLVCQQNLSANQFLRNLKYLTFNTQVVSEFQLIALQVFAPQIQSISFENNRQFTNLESILKVLFKMKQLKTLKISVQRPINNSFKEICTTVKNLELKQCNAETVFSFSQHFTQVNELILNEIVGKGSNWDFSHFKYLRKLKLNPFQNIQRIESLNILNCLEYLDLDGCVWKSNNNFLLTNILQHKSLQSLIIPSDVILGFLEQTTNLVNLKLNVSDSWRTQYTYQDTINNISNFVQKSPQLKSLWINNRNCNSLKINYESVLSKLSHLSLLYWKYSRQQQLINSISNHQTQLLYLSLQQCVVSDKGIMAIQKHLRKLLFLRIQLNIMNNNLISYISKIKTLKQLVLETHLFQVNLSSRCNNSKIMRNCKQLKNIKLTTPTSERSMIIYYKVLRNEIITIHNTHINDKKEYLKAFNQQINSLDTMRINFQLDKQKPQYNRNTFSTRHVPNTNAHLYQRGYQQQTHQRQFRTYGTYTNTGPLYGRNPMQRQIIKQKQIKISLSDSRRNNISKQVYPKSKFHYTNQF